MRRSKPLSRALIVGVSLALLLSAAQGADPQKTPAPEDAGRYLRIEASTERKELSPSSGPPRGIVSYGKTGMSLGPAPAVPGDPLASPESVASPAVGALRKISGVPMAGRVTAFALDPGGTTAVYIADQETVGRFELYRVPVNGSSAPIKLSAGLPFGAGDVGVRRFEITPNGARVVFLADAHHGAGSDDVFSVPIDGSAAALRLNAGTEAPVSAFGLAPDSASVVFFGIDTAFGSGRVEAYAASIGTAASARQISDAGAGVAGANVVFAVIAPDSARVVYAADPAVDGRFQWFSVPMGAAAPGLDVQLSAALGSVNRVAISPDSATVAYTADELLVGVSEVYSVPITGGVRTRLNPSMAGAGARTIEISPDGTRVGYLADQNTAGVVEVYRALLGTAGSGMRLNTPMAGIQQADTLNISPDSTTVLFEADQTTAGTFELFAVPINAGAAPTTLHPFVPPDNVGFFEGRGTPIVGRRAVYPAFGAAVDLFSVPYDGSEPYVRLNDALAAGRTVRNAFVPRATSRLMAFGTGPDPGTVTTDVHAVPVRRDLPQERVNVTAGAGRAGVLGYEISASETHAVYLQDQDTQGKPELYSRELDSDLDGAVNGADNCAFIANPAQGRVVFAQTVRADGPTRFSWNAADDVRFVRGPLNMVDVLATNDSGTRRDARSLTDTTTPASGAGFYYIFAPDCPGRSYQTTAGAEPARDLAPFP